MSKGQGRSTVVGSSVARMSCGGGIQEQETALPIHPWGRINLGYNYCYKERKGNKFPGKLSVQ
ncbi:hypothetical protein EJB05_29123 [Eragrostis curvula]|uniref:Uncharacterized protein n=1 Tax=Eragrostis curvula TaxID=38414 RepID=A0A5J9UU30_9POAL|nr:hypothetical protein EJB05_29123 [Eragrostis curvula]